MARFTTLSFESGTVVANGGTKTLNVSVPNSYLNIYKIRVAPSNNAATATFEIFKKDTFLAADRIYRASNFSGTFVDPISIQNALKTERAQGFLFPYEDDDASSELHLKFTNSYTQNVIFTVSIVYEVPTTVSPTVDVDPIPPGTELTDFADSDLWLPLEAAPKFGMDVAQNGDGTATFSTSVDSASGYYHSCILISRFLVAPDVTTGNIVIRSAWQNVNIKPVHYSDMNAFIACGLCPLHGGDSQYWRGSVLYHQRGHALNAYAGLGASGYTNGPHYNYAGILKSISVGSWPITNFQMRFKWGKLRHIVTQYWATGQNEDIYFYKYEAQPWDNYSVGGGAPPNLNGGEMAGKFRIHVGLYVYDYLESGLYATLTGLEVEEGLIIPN